VAGEDVVVGLGRAHVQRVHDFFKKFDLPNHLRHFGRLRFSCAAQKKTHTVSFCTPLPRRQGTTIAKLSL